MVTKPIPIWQKWLKDPKKAERLFMIFWLGIVLTNILVVVGFIILIILLVKR